MKDKLEPNMYVRTLNGIVKIDKIQNDVMKDTKGCLHYGDFIKASHNIIDLIEVGDYVNGEKVSYIDDCDGAMKEYYYNYEDVEKDCGHYFEEIKSILTKEMFESMKYEVK